MRNDNFDVPILFLIYRQPEITRATFERIRQIKPSRLYIAADGPHRDRPSEKDECELTRRVIDQIDWPCEVEKRFLPENVGLKKVRSFLRLHRLSLFPFLWTLKRMTMRT